MENTNQLQLTQAHLDEMLANISGHVNAGPVTINWDFTTSPLQVTVSVLLLGKPIGQGVLDAKHPTLTIGGTVGPFTAKVTLTFDIPTMTLKYDVELKFGPFPKHYSGSVKL